MSFKSAVLLSHNKIVIDQLKFPKLRYGQALVKIMYSSICHTQVQEIIGQRGKDHYLPHCLGHEAVGSIADKHKSVIAAVVLVIDQMKEIIAHPRPSPPIRPE